MLSRNHHTTYSYMTTQLIGYWCIHCFFLFFFSEFRRYTESSFLEKNSFKTNEKNTEFRYIYLFGLYVAFNTVKVISRRVILWAEETSTYSSSGFCTVNCRPTASNYQFSHLRPCREPNLGLRGGRRECYHSATVAPEFQYKSKVKDDGTLSQGSSYRYGRTKPTEILY